MGIPPPHRALSGPSLVLGEAGWGQQDGPACGQGGLEALGRGSRPLGGSARGREAGSCRPAG